MIGVQVEATGFAVHVVVIKEGTMSRLRPITRRSQEASVTPRFERMARRSITAPTSYIVGSDPVVEGASS